MANTINEMGVLVGYACNFACAHCVTYGEKQVKLSPEEIRLIISQVNRYGIKSLLFVGGETSLYIRDINAILSEIRNLNSTKVKITTNGHFAVTKSAAKKTLLSFHKLNAVQLSYDKFHAKFLSFRNVRNLHAACKDLGMGFSVILTIESPMDIVYAQKLWAIGKVTIGIQKVLKIGAAAKNSNAYVFQSFDKKVLRKFCPNLKKIKYLPGHGFSICCSMLAYKYPEDFVHGSIGHHFRSKFYKEISTKSFQEIADSFGMDVKNLEPQHSHECNLCEYLFRRGRPV